MPPTFEPRETKGSTGPIISIVIIFLLMIAGAAYLWHVHQERKLDTVTYIPGDQATTSGE